jgi:F0F1-type ATP synthase delta subunit
MLSLFFMAEGEKNELDRIEWALTRIERAVQQNKLANAALARRHAALKSRMAEALTALDEVIAREGGQ